MNKLREAIRLILNTKLSNRKIGLATGLAHTTISKYRRTLSQQEKDWIFVKSLNDTDVERLLKTSRKRVQTKRLPDWAHIHHEMQTPNVTLQTLWEEYCIEAPNTAYGYSSFTQKYRKYRRKLGISMRQSHRAGECVFIDFAGTTIPYCNADTNEKRNAQIFVGTLGCSNYTFCCALKSQGLPDWIEAHNKMFQYFGGIPELIVPDNLKSAVIRAGREPSINRTYLELCQYYGVVVLPTRVRHPQDKAKAEVTVLIVTRWIIAKLRHRKFFSIEEINQAILELLWQLNERPFKKLPGCRRSRFEELDKPLLRPLPCEPFEYAEWFGKQKVVSDYHIHVNGHYYSVPYQLVGSQIEARVTSKTVEVFHLGRRIASHLKSYDIGGHTTQTAHQPKSHRLYAQQTQQQILEWAHSTGEAAVAVVEDQFQRCKHEALAVKACGNLQKLAKEHGEERFEAACRRAQYIGSLTVKSVRAILQRRLIDVTPEDRPIQIDLPLHNNVRGADYYGDAR